MKYKVRLSAHQGSGLRASGKMAHELMTTSALHDFRLLTDNFKLNRLNYKKSNSMKYLRFLFSPALNGFFICGICAFNGSRNNC